MLQPSQTAFLVTDTQGDTGGGGMHTRSQSGVQARNRSWLNRSVARSLSLGCGRRADPYDYDCDDNDSNDSNDASVDFYDAPEGAMSGTRLARDPLSLPSVRVNMDPQERLIEALEALREVVVENTNTKAAKMRPRPPPPRPKDGMKLGSPTSPKDERLKIRKSKVIVEIRVVFLKIGEIDTLKEQYSADTFIQAKWREPLLDGKVPEELKKTDLEKYWNPLLYIDNILSETKEATWLTASPNGKGEVTIYERRRVRGIFLENLELNDFPLDVQDLTVTITTERPDTEIDLIPDENEMSGINIQTFVDQQEWHLHEHVEHSKRMITEEYSSSSRCHPAICVTSRAARRPGYFFWNVFLIMEWHLHEHIEVFKKVMTQEYSNSNRSHVSLNVTCRAARRPGYFFWNVFLIMEWELHEHIEMSKKIMRHEFSASAQAHPALSTTCRASRRPGYFYWNVFLVMFFISALSFATFSVSPELPQNRLQLSFTLLLTSVAFKFVINQSLPKISYLTYMDKYVLLSLVILCVVCIWHAVVTVFAKEGKQFLADLEKDVFIAFSSIYILCHVVFIFWLYFDACKRRRIMRKKDKEYLAMLQFYQLCENGGKRRSGDRRRNALRSRAPRTADDD